MKARANFRRMLKEKGAILAPGCFDCFSARILERLGFSALYLTGYGAGAVRLGMPDLGLMTLTEMAELAGNITKAISIPLISDIDTGYGGVINVARTIQAFERAGVAAVHLEDQSPEKKCSLMPGRKVIAAEEMVMKIKAAVDSRSDPDFVIIGRSDAKQPISFEETLRRLHLYLDAGADIVMTAEAATVNEFEILGKEFPNRVAIVVGGSEEPETALPAQEYERMGIKLLVHPTASLGAAGKAVQAINRTLYEKGCIPLDMLTEQTMLCDQINEILSLDKHDTFISTHTVPKP
ncbi:MAG: isocitrate lyase/PEP mutase family protein [Bacillota bacterium]|jgi:2-methylisocitrate lyase-like PEP mutase family enzyme